MVSWILGLLIKDLLEQVCTIVCRAYVSNVSLVIECSDDQALTQTQSLSHTQTFKVLFIKHNKGGHLLTVTLAVFPMVVFFLLIPETTPKEFQHVNRHACLS